MMYGEENSLEHQQPQVGSSQSSTPLGTTSSTVSVVSDGIAMGSTPAHLNGQPAYAYQIQQQYGQYYSQTITTPPPLPPHTALFIHETPVSPHQYVQQQPQAPHSQSLAAPSLPALVQHPTVYIQDSQMALPAYTQHPAPSLPLQQSTTTVYLQEMAKQSPPGLPPPLPSMPGQQPMYIQETVQHPPPSVHPPPGAGHQSHVILQESLQHPPPFLAPPPGSGQQSTFYIHESAMTNPRLLPPPQQTIYVQGTSVSPQPYMQPPPGTALGPAMQGSSSQQQSTIIIHETGIPSQQFVASCPPLPISSLQLQPTLPQFVPQQHNVIVQQSSLMQAQGSQSVYGQLAFASDYNTFPSYMTHQNALPPTSAEEISQVNDTPYWMPCS